MTASMNPGGSTGKVENDRVLPYNFQIGQVIQEAWAKVSGVKGTYFVGIFWYFLFTVLILGVVGLLIYLFHLGPVDSKDPNSLFNTIQNIVTLVLYPIWVGLGYIAIRRSVNLPIESKQCFYPYHYFWRLIGKLIVITLFFMGIVLFSFLLTFLISSLVDMIAPSLTKLFMGLFVFVIILLAMYLMFGFAYASLLIVEKNFRILQSLGMSLRGFHQHGFKIIVLNIVVGLIVMISAIPFFIGLIWTIPLALNVYGIMYRTIFGIEDSTKNS